MLGRTRTIPGAMIIPSVSRPPEGLRKGMVSPTVPPLAAIVVVVISMPAAVSRVVTLWSATISSAGSRCRSVIGWPAPMPTRSLRPMASAGSSSSSAGANPATRPDTRSPAVRRLPLASGCAARSVSAAPGATGSSPVPLRIRGGIEAAAPVRRTRTHGRGASQVSSTAAQVPPRGATRGGWAQSGRSRRGAAICGAGTPAFCIASCTKSTAISPVIGPAERGSGPIRAPKPIPRDKSSGRREITRPAPPCPETGPGARQRPKAGGQGRAGPQRCCGRTA